MIRIANEVDGKKYELVPAKNFQNKCDGCAFCVMERKCLLPWSCDRWYKSINRVCGAMHGIWKEVKDEN